MKNSTPILLDRLAGALQKYGVQLKRMQLLQTAAAALGYRNSHEMAASDDAGDLAPSTAKHLLTTCVPGIGDMDFLQDPDGNVFAVQHSRISSEAGRADDWIISPFGGIVDVSALRSRTTSVQVSAGETAVQKTLSPNQCGAVGEEAIRHLAIRSQLNRAIYKVVRGHVMGNMADADDHLSPYPLVDLMSNPAPADIGTGEMEMVSLVDDIEEAVRQALGLRDEPQADPDIREDFYLGQPVPRFTNACHEITMPQLDDEPDISAHYRGPFRDAELPPIDPEQPAYMTSGCCEVATVTQKDLEELGLSFGSFDGEFYPLTDAETLYIAEDVVDAADGRGHDALIGYAVLYRGKKHLMPSVEIANGPDEDFPFPPRDQVVDEAKSYAERIQPKVSAMGGNVLVNTDQDDRVIVQLLVPIESAMAMGSPDAWRTRLSNLLADPDVAKTVAGRYPMRREGREYAVSIDWIGEGEDGDYQPDDPADVPLLRFDVQRLVDNRWEEVENGSYCTQVPAWCSIQEAQDLAAYLVNEIEANSSASVKRLLERLSWTSENDIKGYRKRKDELEAQYADSYEAHETYGNPEQGTSVDLRRRPDGSVRCEVYVDLSCAAVFEGRDLAEVHAWLKTLPCDQESDEGGVNPSAALAPQWNAPNPESIRWKLVDEYESESNWFEPNEDYPFDQRFIKIEDMTV